MFKGEETKATDAASRLLFNFKHLQSNQEKQSKRTLGQADRLFCPVLCWTSDGKTLPRFLSLYVYPADLFFNYSRKHRQCFLFPQGNHLQQLFSFCGHDPSYVLDPLLVMPYYIAG